MFWCCGSCWSSYQHPLPSILCLGGGRRWGEDCGGEQIPKPQWAGGRGQEYHDPERGPHLGPWWEAGWPDGQIRRPSSRSKSLTVTEVSQAWTACHRCTPHFCVMHLTHTRWCNYPAKRKSPPHQPGNLSYSLLARLCRTTAKLFYLFINRCLIIKYVCKVTKLRWCK